ncbi:DUF4328 domain-containing protein [Streptomyces sp. NPDC016309]|uniref:DUF4328 domain-containing protein n=1 Tax=Streptomyces sp. NPDC016309 TaxID=3364965 RepID=UPI0036FA8368
MSPAPVPAGGGGPLLRSPVGLGHAVVTLLCAVIAADLFAVFADLRLYGFMSDVAAGGWDGAEVRAERADLLMTTAGRAQVLTLVATAVVFVVWLHRVRVNAAVLAPGIPTSGAGWAIGGWFVPVVNLWMPRRIVRESWRASGRAPYGVHADEEPATVVNVWWALWLLTVFVGRAAAMAYDKADSPERLVAAARLMVAADSLSVAAAVCAVLVVRRLTAMQHTKALGVPVPVVAQPMGSRHTE